MLEDLEVEVQQRDWLSSLDPIGAYLVYLVLFS